MDPRTETLQEMQIRIAREMQAKDAARASYWEAIGTLAGKLALPGSKRA